MSFLYLFLLFFMSSSAINRDTDFVLCGTKKACHSLLLIGVFNPTLNKLPCLFVCTHQKLFSPIIYRPRPNVFLPLLLWLSGDVSLNPRPTNSNHIRMATVDVRSIRQKFASFSDLVTTKSLTQSIVQPVPTRHRRHACIQMQTALSGNTRTWPNVVSMLAQRRWRWANIETALGQILVFAGSSTQVSVYTHPSPP